MSPQNSDTIITALTSFALHHKGHKITIVWDNAGWHKSKKLRHELATNQTLAGIQALRHSAWFGCPFLTGFRGWR